MGKRVLIFFVFCLGVWLSACQAGPIQTNIQPISGPRQKPSSLQNKEIKSGVIQKKDQLFWYDRNGNVEAEFKIFNPATQSAFKTQFMDLGGRHQSNNIYYDETVNPINHDLRFGGRAINPATNRFEKPFIYASFSSSVSLNDFYIKHPSCKPRWEIYLDNEPVQNIEYQPNTYTILFPEKKIYLNKVLKIIRTPLTCQQVAKQNKIFHDYPKAVYKPIGRQTYTTLFSYYSDLDALAPFGHNVDNFSNELFKGNLLCSANTSKSLQIHAKKMSLHFQKLEYLRTKTFGTRFYQFDETESQPFKIQSGSPPSEEPDDISSFPPSDTPSEEPSPDISSAPTPSPLFFSEVPVVENNSEFFAQIDTEAHYLRDYQILWQGYLDEIQQIHEKTVDEKKNSPLPEDQEEVQKALTLIQQTTKLKNDIAVSITEINTFIQELQCPIQRYNYETSILPYYNLDENGVLPAFNLSILDAYFRPTNTDINPYAKELVILIRIGNLHSFKSHFNVSSNGFKLKGMDVLEDQQAPSWQYSHEEDPFYLFPLEDNYIRSYMQYESNYQSNYGYVTLILKKWNYTTEFLQAKKISPENTQDTKLFNGIPIQLEVEIEHIVPPNYFEIYPADKKVLSNLYIINPLGLQVLDIPENEEVVYLDGAALFSPRDQNVQFDRLAIPLDVPPGSGWNMKLLAQDDLEGEPFWQTSGTGPQQVVWDGFSEENCVPENKYVLRASDSQGNVISEQTLAVDSTPPLVKELDIQVDVKQTEPEEVVETTVKFQVFDPLIKGVAAGLNLDKWQLQIDVDDAPLFATPLRDPDGFWVASTLPQNQITVESVDPRTAKVEFKLPYRLDGRMVKVRARDRVGNQVWQLIQSQGGLF